MSINELINKEIDLVEKYDGYYLVYLSQTDPGDDGVYIVDSNKNVEYASAIGLFGDKRFNGEAESISVKDFISSMK